MSRITITIDTDNAAFNVDEGAPEVARILSELSEQMQESGEIPDYLDLRDINGNTVGAVRVSR